MNDKEIVIMEDVNSSLRSLDDSRRILKKSLIDAEELLKEGNCSKDFIDFVNFNRNKLIAHNLIKTLLGFADIDTAYTDELIEMTLKSVRENLYDIKKEPFGDNHTKYHIFR